MVSAPLSADRRRIGWLDGCRASAVAMIVGYHMLYPVFDRLPFWRSALGAFCDAGTVIFVMIAAFLFRNGASGFNYRRFMVKKLIYIACPYAIASFLLTGLRMVRDGGFSVWNFLTVSLGSLPTGSASAPLWFVPMLLVFFAAAPIFLYIDRRKLYPYLSPLLILPFAVGRGRFDELGRNMLYFLPFFISGMAFSAFWSEFRACWARYGGLMSAAAAIFLAASAFSESGDVWPTAARIAVAVCMFGLWPGHERAALLPVRMVAADGMAIYLYHNQLIGLAFAPWLRRIADSASSPAVLAAWLLATLAATAVLAALFSAFHALSRRFGLSNTRWLFGR